MSIDIGGLIDQGRLVELVDQFQAHSQTTEPPIGEALCKEMWRHLGHHNPRSFLLPFLLARLPRPVLLKIAHTHIALMVMFIGEVGEEVKADARFLRILGTDVVARLFLEPTTASNEACDDKVEGDDLDSRGQWAALREQFERLPKDKQDIITRLFPRIHFEEGDEECSSLGQVVNMIYRQLGNKYQVYIERQRTEYRELREHNWKVADYTHEPQRTPQCLTLNDLEAFVAQGEKYTGAGDKSSKRRKPRGEVLLVDFDLFLNPQRILKGEAQVAYVLAVIDKVLQRNNFVNGSDAYHVDYDPAVLEPIGKLYDANRLLSVISHQTLDAVRKILMPLVPKTLVQQKNGGVVYSEEYDISRMLVTLALVGLDRACGSREVYSGRLYGREIVHRCLQIEFPLNKHFQI